MKLKLSLVTAPGQQRDITLACDVTTTVTAVARELLRSGAVDDPELATAALDRAYPVTMLARSKGSAMLLDPMSPIGASGMFSGDLVEVVAEFGQRPAADEQRAVPVAGYLEVLNGAHAGALFSLVEGNNLVGRGVESRVHLSDASVSRRHAAVIIAAGAAADLVVRDLGGANGVLTEAGEPVAELYICGPCELLLGDVRVRITPGPPSNPAPLIEYIAGASEQFTRSPRIEAAFAKMSYQLPKPPQPPPPARMPLLAMIAPMLMGAAMYALTASPMSLLMVAGTPIMMVGSWLDGKWGGTRRTKRELAGFRKTLATDRQRLRELNDEERDARIAASPSPSQVTHAISERSRLLWARRPEHDAFLEVQLGHATLPSHTRIELPDRGAAADPHWQELTNLAKQHERVSGVPLTENLRHCGALGICGDPVWTQGITRAIIAQLVGLHSPAELMIACFAAPGSADEWDWLKWLPHTDGAALAADQLASDEVSALRLVAALEGLVETRASARGDPQLPAVTVVVLGAPFVQARLIALAEAGPACGVYSVWLAAGIEQLPAACHTFAEFEAGEGDVSFVRSGERHRLDKVEPVSLPAAIEFARRLAPLEDAAARSLDESDLPRTVPLGELMAVDILGGGNAIAAAWSARDSLKRGWVQGRERAPAQLTAVVGQSAEGKAVIDLRTHGPHALVGGTTGAGKSEFLQSWIMSLAAGISPDEITFLLIDYKGGSAFAECVDLPHAVGLVTDLSPRLVRRALVSLRAELRHREQLLADHGAKDLVAMQRRSDAAAPPSLVIVIDEFAALAREVPEFVEGVLDIAQRGRSLGLHLIMATQRPAGVISDNLRANTNLRVALRMADEQDSLDVLGVRDAAWFAAETPGRAAFKIGPGRISHFQAGYLGECSTRAARVSMLEIRSLGFGEGEPWNVPADPALCVRAERNGPRDIEQLRDAVVDAARIAGVDRARRPWLDELPTVIGLGELHTGQGAAAAAGGGVSSPPAIGDAAHAATLGIAGVTGSSDAVALGLQDLPAQQEQTPLLVDLEHAGNVAFIGASGTGKTSALVSLAAALSRAAPANPVRLYVIDAGGALEVLARLPTVGAVAQLTDTELVMRVLRTLSAEIVDRGERFAAAQAAGLRAYREAGYSREPRIVLLVDGLAALRQAAECLGPTEGALQLLGEIMASGRAAGVHVVLTADRPAAVPAAMASTIQRQFVLRLAGAFDYGHLGLRPEDLDGAPPGRAVVVETGTEVQLALAAEGLGHEAQSRAAQSAAIAALAERLRVAGVERASPVRNAPHEVPLEELPVAIGERPVFGIDVTSLAPASMPTQGLTVIAGPAGSGLSTAVRSCAHAAARHAAHTGRPCTRVLLTLADPGLATAGEWDYIASGDAAVAAWAGELAAALGGATGGAPALGLIGDPEPGFDAARAQRAVAAAGTLIVVIERAVDAEGTAALTQLVALARAARRGSGLVIFEFEQSSGASWELLSALRQPTWGLSLQPDAAESHSPFRESMGRVRRADFVQGRGMSVERGAVRQVHVALPPQLA